MSAWEMWVCDWHASNGPESDDDVVNEDQARDDGWVRIDRTVKRPSALDNGRTWSHQEICHVCPCCLEDPECREWIADGGFSGYFTEDAQRLDAAGVGAGVMSSRKGDDGVAVLVYDEIPPSSNQNNGVGGRGDWRGIARTKGKWEGIFAMLLLSGRVPRGLEFVSVVPELQFKTKHRRDADNWYFAVSKPLGDAMVRGGWLSDDTPDRYQMERVRIFTGVEGLPPLVKKGRMILRLDYRCGEK